MKIRRHNGQQESRAYLHMSGGECTSCQALVADVMARLDRQDAQNRDVLDRVEACEEGEERIREAVTQSAEKVSGAFALVHDAMTDLVSEVSRRP